MQGYEEEIRKDADIANFETSFYNAEKRIRIYFRHRSFRVVYIDSYGIERAADIPINLYKAIKEFLEEIRWI